MKYDFMGLCVNRFISVTRDQMLDQKPDVPPFEVRTRHRHAWHWKKTVSHTEWVYFDIYSKSQAPQG